MTVLKQLSYKPRSLADLAVGNDKTLTTDTEDIGLEFEVLAITVAATSGVGTRLIDVVISDENAVELFRLVDIIATLVADATLSAYIYAGSGDGEFPPFVFRPGWTIQVVDTADIDVLDTVAVNAYFSGTDVIG